MIRKFLRVACVGFLTLTVAFAQQPSTTAPSVDRLRQVITYLASDALEGRRTGTPVANDAAQYMAGEFNRLGLREAAHPAPTLATQGGSPAAYFLPFPDVSN